MVSLLTVPGKAWDEIAAHESGKDIMFGYVYPLIGLCGLSEFVGTFIGKSLNSDMFQLALTRCCAVAVALFGGFFLASYLLDKLNRRWLRRTGTYDDTQLFVGYSMTVVFVMNIVSGLISIELLHWILQIYTIVIVFEGARRMVRVGEERLTAYTVIATVVILICPALIEYIFNKLTVILN